MSRLLTITLLLVGLSAASAAGASFVSLGDWGGAAVQESTYKENTYAVAEQMAKTASQIDAKFVVNVGDNFYWCGIENTTDFQIAADWLNPYNHPSLDIPWYGVLGNHEYGYNVSAQLEMTALFNNWVLPARYYAKRVKMAEGQFVSFVFIDSSPCVQEYRSTDRSGWDPCGTEYPTCSITGGTDDFEGECHFHENIMTQSCPDQYTWFKKAIAAMPDDDWKIVVAHHPADEMDEADFITPMQQAGVDLYINGHVHTLNQYAIDGDQAYVTTGAASMVSIDYEKAVEAAGDSHDQEPNTPGKFRTYAKGHDLPLPPYNGHQYSKVWNQKVAGFTSHTFSDDYSSITTKYITFKGDVVNSFTVQKGKGIGSAAKQATAAEE